MDAPEVSGSAPFQAERRPEPCALVLFGATGDLARRKLIPGLYNLWRERLLPPGFAVIGVGRSAASRAELLDLHREATTRHSRTPFDGASWEALAARIDYVRGDVDQAATYADLRAALTRADAAGAAGNRLYTFAVPPDSFPVILEALRAAGLLAPVNGEGPFTRVMIEKPFGRDLPSAQALNRMAAAFLDERQIYRIDHYLGKETVQNIHVLRFGNAIFEPLWNRKYIDHVQITGAEELGLEGRGRFYDETGALRDVIQNHLLEVLALVAMEPPVSFRADDQRDARVAVLRSLRAVDVETEVVQGQYEGYHDEPHVAPGSTTPTYAAVKLFIDNWRWQGVPFYLRAGKRLARRATEVAIHFQRVPLCLFGRDEVCQRLDANVLTLRLQPDEGISLRFVAKAPGEDVYVDSVHMDFAYARAFTRQPAEAYERLFLDGMRGDASLFARRDGVERAWEIVTPILEAWRERGARPAPYAPGSQGPAEADALIRRDGRRWRELT
jgi:glucose-6-phosphate 1-dehydrogenase